MLGGGLPLEHGPGVFLHRCCVHSLSLSLVLGIPKDVSSGSQAPLPPHHAPLGTAALSLPSELSGRLLLHDCPLSPSDVL